MESLNMSFEEIIDEYVKENSVAGIDEVSIKSLLRGSMEFDNPGGLHAKVIIKKKGDSSVLQSVSLKNYKFRLRYGLDLVLGVYSVITKQEKLAILLYFLRFIRLCVDQLIVEIKESHAKVIWEIYKMDYNGTGIEEERLIEEIKKYNSEMNHDTFMELANDLMKIGCIDCSEGRYTLKESVVI